MGRILGGGRGVGGLEKGGNAPCRLRIRRDVNPPQHTYLIYLQYLFSILLKATRGSSIDTPMNDDDDNKDDNTL